MALLRDRVSMVVRHYCGFCGQVTPSIPCPFCPYQTVTCAGCGQHHDCWGPDDD